jgi:hypothetical protein
MNHNIVFSISCEAMVWNVSDSLRPEIQRILQQHQAFIETQSDR